MQKFLGSKLVLLGLLAFGFAEVQASSFVNPAFKLQPGELSVGTGFLHSRVDYEISNSDVQIQRAILGADLSYGLSRFVDLYADLGFTLKSEIEKQTTNGSGFVFGAGARGIIHKYNSLSVYGTGGFLYQLEDYASSMDGSHFEVNLGAFLGYELNPMFDFFAGLDLIPFSDGEIETEVSGLRIDGFNTKTDASTDVDQLLSVRLGSNVHWKQFTFRPEVSLFAKRNLALHASTIF